MGSVTGRVSRAAAAEAISMAPRRAGAMQGALAILVGYLPILAFVSLPPALPELTAHFAGAPGAAILVPVIVTAPSACVALLAPFAGLIADKIGRRGVVMAALAVFTLCGLAPLELDDLRLIVVSRLLLGVANAGLITVGTTLIGDYFEGSARRRWFAINGVAASLLATAAMLAGGALADLSWREPFWLYLAGLPILVLCWFWLYEPTAPAAGPAAADGGAQAFPWRFLAWISAVTVVCSLLYNVEPVHIGLVLSQVGAGSATLIGTVAAVASVGVPLGAALYGRLSATWPVSAQIALVLALFGVGLLGVGAAPSYVLVGAAALPQQIGAGLLMPVLMHWCQEGFSFRRRARGTGLWIASFFAAQFGSPILVSVLAGHVGGLRPAIVLLGAVSLMLCVPAVVPVFSLRRPRRS